MEWLQTQLLNLQLACNWKCANAKIKLSKWNPSYGMYPIAGAQRYTWWSNPDTETESCFQWSYMNTLSIISHNVHYRAVTVDKLKTDTGQTTNTNRHRHNISSFPGSLPREHVLLYDFWPNEESRELPCTPVDMSCTQHGPLFPQTTSHCLYCMI